MRQTVDRLRAFGAVPVPDGARRRLAVAVAAAFVVVAVAITTLGSRIPAPSATPPPAPATEAPVTPTASTAPSPVAAAPMRAPTRPSDLRAARASARRFLSGYLPFTYGHGAARRIPAATAELRDALAADRPRVPPIETRRRARVRHLEAEGSRSRGRAASDATVVALVSDGARTYSVGLAVRHTASGWLVTGLRGG